MKIEDKELKITDTTGRYESMSETSVKTYLYQNICAMEIATGEEGGKKWATIYRCDTNPKYWNKGYMSAMFDWFVEKFKDYDKGCFCPLKESVKHLCEKHNITIY